MGTRHLIAVKIDGDYRVAQYGQWDGDPSGQGADVLAFLRGMERAAFVAKVRGCTFISEDELTEMWRAAGAKEDGFIAYHLAESFSKKHPELSRDTGSDILALIAKSANGLRLKDSIDFAKDSLFCEYAYVVDLDAETFEVFRGFNTSPLADGERFKGDGSGDHKEAIEETYYPVRLLKSYPLASLPDKKQFLQDCEPSEDAEEE